MLQRWKLADDVKVLGSEAEIAEAKAGVEEWDQGAMELLAMELRARKEIQNRLIASGLPDPLTGLSQVPYAYAIVPLGEAWEQSQNDLKVCEAILANSPSFLSLCAVHINTVGWAQFWANQHPRQEWRKRFAQAAMEGTMQQDYLFARFKQWEARQC
jgi:hypothetical protein